MNRMWTSIVISGAGTYAMRASFLAFAHRMATVPPALARILRQIPPAALAAIVAPALLRPEGRLDLLQPTLLAGLVAAAVAWKTRNVGITVVAGIALLAALRHL